MAPGWVKVVLVRAQPKYNRTLKQLTSEGTRPDKSCFGESTAKVQLMQVNFGIGLNLVTRGAKTQEFTNKCVFVWRSGAGRLREGDKKWSWSKGGGTLVTWKWRGGTPCRPFYMQQICCSAKLTLGVFGARPNRPRGYWYSAGRERKRDLGDVQVCDGKTNRV